MDKHRWNSDAPAPPSIFVGRANDVANITRALVNWPISQNPPAHSLVVLTGLPGVGKTAAASVIARDPAIVEAFPDGILWASLGRQPDLMSALTGWGPTVGNHSTLQETDLHRLRASLANSLLHKRVLLIVDDVWNSSDASAMMLGGPRCATLMTTRLPQVADEIASNASQIYRLNVLSESQSMDLLEMFAPDLILRHPQEARELARQLEGLPLALQVAARMLRTTERTGFELDEVLTALRESPRVLVLSQSEPIQALATVSAVLKKSTDGLAATARHCFAQLAPFAASPATFDLKALRAIWPDVDDRESVIAQLTERGLLESVGDGRFWLHSLLVAHAKELLVAGES